MVSLATKDIFLPIPTMLSYYHTILTECPIAKFNIFAQYIISCIQLLLIGNHVEQLFNKPGQSIF